VAPDGVNPGGVPVRTAGRYFGGDLPPADGRRVTPHEQVQADPEFVALRRRLRGFAFPASAAFLLWYLAFVLLASYARELMATPVVGAVNLGLVIGLAQFATTFALTTAYVVYAGRHLDPRAARVRAQVEARLPVRPDPAPTGTAPPFATVRSGPAPFGGTRGGGR
jgi:uncharacterized membrane protein (DUF485 family)